MEEKQSSPVSEKQQQSFNHTEPTENHHQPPRKARALEKQVSFQGVNVQPSRLRRSIMEKQLSFRGVTTTTVENNHKLGVMEKLPSFGKATTMEKQKSFRGGFLEKQKSFRVVMERQLRFIGERRKKTDSPGKRGDSPLLDQLNKPWAFY